MGGRILQEHIKHKLGIDFGQTTDDGMFTLEDIYCFGNCACAPSVMVDGKLYGRAFPERIDAIIENVLRKGVKGNGR